MKLLSLHVTAFGGISNRDLTFSEGLTEIIEYLREPGDAPDARPV